MYAGFLANLTLGKAGKLPESHGVCHLWFVKTRSRQKDFFENGAAAFQAKERPARQVEEKQKRIESLEKKVQSKDEVLAELMAEHVALKKVLGSFDQELGAA
jgi:hypothetical protein